MKRWLEGDSKGSKGFLGDLGSEEVSDGGGEALGLWASAGEKRSWNCISSSQFSRDQRPVKQGFRQCKDERDARECH